jgi:drug/metabolite transporter (DMT)-like permease
MEKLFAVIGMLANAGKDTVFKVAAGEENGSRTNLFYALKGAFIAVMALFILVVVKRAPLIHPVSLLWALPIAALVYSSYMLALRSLVYGTASTNVTIFRLNFVLTAVIAAPVFHEALTPRKLAGLALCLAAIMVFFWGGRRDNGGGAAADPRAVGRGILLAVLASVCAAGLNTVNKLALNAGASVFHLILYRYILVCIIGGVAIAARRQSAIPSRRLLAASAGAAALMLVGLFFVLTALSMAEVTLVIPISQLSFLFTALLSFLILKEKMNWVKGAGIILAVASIGVIG